MKIENNRNKNMKNFPSVRVWLWIVLLNSNFFTSVLNAESAGSNTSDQIVKLFAADGQAADAFGLSVSVDGDRALIGAWGDDDNGPQSGSAYIFERNASGIWTEITKLLPSDGQELDNFGDKVSVSGDIALIGVSGDDDKGHASGSAYIFERNASGNWAETAKLLPSDGEVLDQFGDSVSVDGDTALIGASGDDDKGFNAGSAYIFTRNAAGVWIESAKLLAGDGRDNHGFGDSVSLDGNTAIIGAWLDHDDGFQAGAAYIFTRNTAGAWVETTKLLPSDGRQGPFLGPYFGWSVSLDGDTALIGAYRDDDKGISSGSAYIFTRNAAGVWMETTKLLASDGQADDNFGDTVSINGDKAVIGAPLDVEVGKTTGSAYFFERFSTGVWIETSKLVEIDDQSSEKLAISVSLDGNTALIGAMGSSDKSPTGLAYIFDLKVDPASIPNIIGTYEGALAAETTDCVFDNGEPAEEDDAFTLSGGLAINSQNGEQFSGTGGLMINRFGFTGQVNLNFSGRVAMNGNIGGTYTENFNLSNGFSSQGNGTFSGSVTGDKLTMQISGQDRDITGITCKFTGAFAGVDPNREALPVVTIQASDSEAAEIGPDPCSFTITRTGASVNPLTVNYTIDGIATNGDDYNFVPSFVIIPAGSVSVTITVTPIDDSKFEEDETVRLTLKSDIAYSIGSPSSAIATILDNDETFTLTIVSAFGNPQGSATYKEGTEAFWSVTTPWPSENGENGVRNIADTPSNSLIMHSNETITINWQLQYFLTIKSDNSQGSEIGNPVGQGWYDENTSANWSVESPRILLQNKQRYVADLSSGTTIMDSPKTVSIDWKLQLYLDTSTNGGGSINLGPSWINDGEQVTLEATNTSNFTFARWFSKSANSSDQSTDNPWTVTIDQAKRVYAIFTPSGSVDPHNLEVNKGWNYFSLPHFPTNPVIDKELGAEVVGTIWERLEDQLNMSVILKPKTGYWIYCSENTSINIPGILDTFTTSALTPGWNYTGVSSSQKLPEGSSIAWYWDGVGFKVANSLVPWLGYWIYIQE